MSFRWAADLKTLSIDRTKYDRALNTHMVERTRKAGQVWLARVLIIIPTWSRASRATFESLAQAVGFNITYGPQRSRKDRLLLGLQTGRGGLDRGKFAWHFFYETDLRYLAYNELNAATPGSPPQPFGELKEPTPYNFQDAGRDAFEAFATTVRLPNPYEYLKIKQL